MEAGLSSLGKSAPEDSDEESFDVLCDFFARAVFLPGYSDSSSNGTEPDRLVRPNDVTRVFGQLFMTRLARHRLRPTTREPAE